LFSCAASAQTYPVSGVWVASDVRFPGSTKGACFILRKIGIDAVSSQPFPSLMIYSDNKRFEVRGNFRAERTVRSLQTATDGRFRITESPGNRRWLHFLKRPLFTLKIVDATIIEVTEGNIITRFYKVFAQSITLTRPSDREVPQGQISIAVIWIKSKTFSSRSGVLRSGALDPEANFL
jgi:hypothetical protein